MVKFLGIIAVVVASLTIAQQAQARHGCRSCGGGYSGCPGGNCSVSYAPAKSADMSNAPPGLAAAPTSDSAPVVTTARPAPMSYAYAPARRGLFGRR